MSAFEVYLIMQLDTFVFFLFVLGVLSLFGAFFVLMADDFKREGTLATTLLRAATVSLFLAAITPNTKTFALMYVVPALTSDEVVDSVRPEMRELYELAKEALRERGVPSAVSDGDNQ